MDAFYNKLIKATIHQNQMLENQLQMKLHNYDKLYYKTETPLDDRLLTIRWVKLPTFMRENKPTYYAIFLVDTPYWRKGELRSIYRQTIESIDAQDVDSHTIYLMGHLHGFFDKMDNRPRYYRIFRLNTDQFTSRERRLVTESICNYLNSRVQQMTMKGIASPVINQDVERLHFFIDTMRVYTCACAPNVSNTSIRKYEVLANIETKTSISNITREGME